MIFQVAEGFLDLHASLIGAHHQDPGRAGMRQRGCQQPRGTVQAPVETLVGPVRLAFGRATRGALVSADEIQPTPVTVTLRQAALPDMANPGCSLGVEGMHVAPAAGFWFEILDGIADAPDPVPAQGFDGAEPGATEAGIGNDDGMNVRGHDGVQMSEELPMRFRAIVVSQGMDFFVEGESTSVHGYRGTQDEQLSLEFTVCPVDDDERSGNGVEELSCQCGVDTGAFTLQMGITQEAVDGFNVMFDEGIAGTEAAQMSQ